MRAKRIAITMGDPGGIGPEVIIKAVESGRLTAGCEPVVLGDIDVMREAAKMCNSKLSIVSVLDISIPAPKGVLKVLDMGPISFTKGAPSRNAGRIIVESVRKAVALAQKGDVAGIVTAPASKESIKKAGFPWPGHTEMLADFTRTERFAMMFVSEKLKVILCTIHIALTDVPHMITKKRVLSTLMHAEKGALMLGIDAPKIGVAGLNPHAGEAGIMGKEELSAIIPAVEAARQQGMDVHGPYPPDVIFHKANNGEFDMVVCMYHDQGLIPFKMIAFDTGVNMTVGLPVIRTSPDHGTAFDIAWSNKANPSSMIEAVNLALRLNI
ncbi:MAG: 4-hydroxythreonine-4-phosphate dehydrogenase PdxA [Nitrospira sp.]|nr:4-hydroxythreonine-4-phosphate dehydrogenase PdxA [bacterium]MBL7047906.1 4-hydroxythreonine-4-phosphate dehydrogenase PdxA [Nitrospira sp.]